MRELHHTSAWEHLVLFVVLILLLLITAPFAFVSWLRWKVHHHGREHP